MIHYNDNILNGPVILFWLIVLKWALKQVFCIIIAKIFNDHILNSPAILFWLTVLKWALKQVFCIITPSSCIINYYCIIENFLENWEKIRKKIRTIYIYTLKIIKILKTASLDFNFTGSYKKECIPYMLDSENNYDNNISAGTHSLDWQRSYTTKSGRATKIPEHLKNFEL